jgi:hypothetical protein
MDNNDFVMPRESGASSFLPSRCHGALNRNGGGYWIARFRGQ